MTQIAKVAVAAATYAIDKPYDYLVPSGMELSVGCRVTVPFGRGNRTAEGMVLQLRQEVPAKPLKAIRSLLDQESVLSEKEIRLALWMRQRYFCTFYDALHTILPAAVWYRYREIWSLCPTAGEEGLTEREQAVCRMLSDGPQERETLCTALGEDIPSVLYQMKKKGLVSVETETSRKIKDHMVELASLAAPAQEVLERLERRRRSAPRQYEAAAFLAKCGETTVHDLCYFTGATRQTLRSLEKQGLIALRGREEYRISPREYGVPAEEITLNQQQQSAYDTILRQTETGRAGVTLLQGVTGSGKTLVYIRLAQTLLEQGKSVMILVPEIALTPQMMARFTAYFGRKVALLHSGLRLTERWDQYKRIRRGEATVVLGTRSAVFAPLERLGLIILDEEQESSYESEKAPCYHARDIAKYRCVQEGARLVLGSATPTVETAYYARMGDYGLCRLTERFNQRRLPQVILADMRRELRDGNFSCISRPLRQELERNLAAGEQSILFLNRRGSSRQLLCPQCGYVPQCPPHLPLRQRTDDVPLLRPLPACTGYLSRLRRRYEAHRLRYTEGGGGADPALSRYGASADGCRYRGRGPREAPAGVPAPPHPYSAGDSDGGQGTGFRRGDAGGRVGGGSVAVRGSLPGGGAHLQPADAGGGPGRPGGEGGPSGDPDLHPPQRRDPGGGGAGL